MADIDFDKKAVHINYHWLVKWGWALVTAALAGHIWLTHQNATAMTAEQQKQNMRLDRIERAITACLDRQLDCEAQRAERIVK